MVNTAGFRCTAVMVVTDQRKFVTAQLATTLKLTETELQTQLRSGKTIKQIAEAQSVDIAVVKATLKCRLQGAP
jgi:DNA-binding CsgD family transcriptional regulator